MTRAAEPATTPGTTRLHRVAPMVTLVAGVVLLVGSSRLPLGTLGLPGAGLWPFAVGVLVTAASLLLLVVDDRADYESWNRGTRNIAVGFAGLAIFVGAFQRLGFLVPGAVLLALWMRFFGHERWRTAVLLGLGGAVVLHLLFVELLGVPFPDDVLLWWKVR